MEVSMKMIKGFKVYNHKAKEPWGIVSDICFDCDTSKVTSIVAETISIVPISKIIAFDEINNIINGAVVLKKEQYQEYKDWTTKLAGSIVLRG